MTKEECFDAICKQIKMLDEQIDELTTERNNFWSQFEALHKEGVQGDEFGSIMKPGRRTVGKDVNVQALSEINTDLVEHIAGKFVFDSYMPDQLKLIESLATKAGLGGIVTDPDVKAPTITEVEKFLKKNPQYNRQRTEIMRYMDIQRGTGTLHIYSKYGDDDESD